MPVYVYYDRRSVTTVETQFFHESRGVHADKEIGTNMEKNLQFPVPFTIKKICIILPPTLLSSATARDTALFNQINIFLNEAIMQIQVGEQPILYLPACAALANFGVLGDVEYSLATAADGSYGIASLLPPNGQFGLDIEIPVPADTDFKFYLKTKSTPAFGTVTVLLYGERGR